MASPSGRGTWYEFSRTSALLGEPIISRTDDLHTMPDSSKNVWIALALAGACLAMSPATARASQPEAPAPHVDESLSLTGTVVWEGLHTRRVVLSLANGAELRGTVVAQDAETLAVARASDGSVVSVPKREITGVRVANVTELGRGLTTSPAKKQLRDHGRKDYTAGAVLLGIGVPIGVSGTAMLGVCFSCLYIHLPLLLPGIGLMIAGSRLMKRGASKNKAFRGDWGIPMARMQLAPSLSLGRGGGELGFTIRF